MRAVSQVVHALISSGARTATKYVAPDMMIRATRRHRPKRRKKAIEIVLTIGRPNHEARKFIARASKAGETFPVRKVQIKHWPAKRRR